MASETKQNDKAKLKQQRIMKYFVEAAAEIIKTEGIEAVTIRKTADLAGYASATLYNYFDSLPHLVFLATMNYLEEYNKAIPQCVSKCKNSIERYMVVCKCFSEYSYSEPHIYELLFFTYSDESHEDYTRQYYELYPEKIKKDWPVPLNKMYFLNSLYSRSFQMLEDCISEGYIEKANAEDFNDVSLRFNKTIIQDVKNGKMDKETAVALTLKYYYQLFRCYMKPEARDILDACVKEFKLL